MNKILYHSPVNKRNILVFPEFKLAYINSAKCGCSTIKTMLAKASGRDFSGYKDIHYAHHSMKFFQHCEFNEIPDDYFKFTSVRNPFDRVVSFYSDKIKNRLYVITKCYGITEENINKYSDFKTFIDLLYERKRFEIHLAHQTTAFYTAKVDHLVRMENFTETLTPILDRIGWESPVPHERKTVHAGYRSYYSEESKGKIAELYHKDLQELKYEF